MFYSKCRGTSKIFLKKILLDSVYRSKVMDSNFPNIIKIHSTSFTTYSTLAPGTTAAGAAAVSEAPASVLILHNLT